MAAETVLVCLCGCGQSEHHVGKKGCKHCPECTRFRAAEEVPAVDVAPVPAEELVADEGLLDAVRAQLAEVTTERASLRLANKGLGDKLAEQMGIVRDFNREFEKLRGELNEARADADLARHLIGRIEKAAGAEDLDPFTGLDEFVRGLRGERDIARREIEQLGAQLEHAEQYARDLQGNGDVPTGIDVLLDQADATKVPAIVATSDSIRDLIGQLREQLAEHESREELREELARIEQRATEIRRVLAEAEKPPAPAVPDKTVRDWARKNGFEVDARGRVPAWLRTQYLHAQSA